MSTIETGPASATRHLVDPDLFPLIDAFPPVPMTAETLSVFREMMRTQADAAHADTAIDGVTQETLTAPSLSGGQDIPLLVTRPQTPGRKPALIHIHGGGMVMGFPGMNAMEDAALAKALDCVVVAPTYRLAPETRFPGPLEDCYSALAWVAAAPAPLDIDPARIVITGDSAGGGLAAALTLYNRDKGTVGIAGQLLVYPMLDHRTGGPDDIYNNPMTGEFIWTRDYNQFGWSALRGDYAPTDERAGWFAPALAESLSDLPPAVILTASLDLFLDENMAYADRLVRAGIPVEFTSYAGAVHAFPSLTDAGVSRRFYRDREAALARLLAP